MKLYRIEHKDSRDGMWTQKFDDKLVLHHLSDKRLADLPMPKSDDFRKYGLIWKTAVPTIEMLGLWFTKNDVIEMVNFGFRLKEFDSDKVMMQKMQTLFVEDSMQNIIDITDDFLKSK